MRKILNSIKPLSFTLILFPMVAFCSETSSERADRFMSNLGLKSGQSAQIEQYQKQAQGQNSLQENQVYMAISLSMPESELRAALSFMARNNVIGVLRGVHPDAPYVDMTGKMLNDVAKGLKDTPDVVINSLMFDEAGVEKAPYLIQKKGGKVYKAPATLELEGFLEGVEAGLEADLEQTLQLVDIAEIHFEQFLKEKLKAVDWENKKEGAVDRYWAKMEMFDLPAATENRAFNVDLSIVLNQDMIEPSTGKVLKRKGEIVNPTKIRPFNRALIVFDPFSERQYEIAIREIEAASKKGQTPIVLLTRVNRKAPSETLNRAAELTGYRPFILDSGVKERFKISKVPSVVTQDGDLMLVREMSE